MGLHVAEIRLPAVGGRQEVDGHDGPRDGEKPPADSRRQAADHREPQRHPEGLVPREEEEPAPQQDQHPAEGHRQKPQVHGPDEPDDKDAGNGIEDGGQQDQLPPRVAAELPGQGHREPQADARGHRGRQGHAEEPGKNGHHHHRRPEAGDGLHEAPQRRAE